MTPRNTPRAAAAPSSEVAAVRPVTALRRQSRLAQWYPIWRLVSALATLALGVILPFGGYWWGLVFVAFGLATLILTRFGQAWRELTPGQKAVALPGLLIGTAIEILIAIECVILLAAGWLGSGSRSARRR
jgi:hypothetical protein